MYHIQHVPQRHFCTVLWRRFHCTIYVQGLRDGSHKYLSASAKSITNFCKYLRNGHRSLPYLPAKLSKGHKLSVFDKIGFTSWRFALRRLHEKRQNPSFFDVLGNECTKKWYVGDIHLPGEHKCFETTSSKPAKSQKKTIKTGGNRSQNDSKSDKASYITRKEQAMSRDTWKRVIQNCMIRLQWWQANGLS